MVPAVSRSVESADAFEASDASSAHEQRLVAVLCALLGRVDVPLVVACTALPEHRVEAVAVSAGAPTDSGRWGPWAHEQLSADPVVVDLARSLLLNAIDGGLRIDATAMTALMRAGGHDRRLLDALIAHDASGASSDDLRASTSAVALQLGIGPDEMALMRARAHLRADRWNDCLRECDSVIADDGSAHQAAALGLAADAEVRRGNATRSLELRRSERPTEASSLVSAVVAAVASGERDDAERFAGALPETLTTHGTWRPTLVRGLVETLSHDQSAETDELIQAAHTALSTGRGDLQLSMPVLMAALAVFGRGDLVAATALVERFVEIADEGSPSAHARLALLFVRTVGGDVDGARELLDELEAERVSQPWGLVLDLLRVAWARRSGEMDALESAWCTVRGQLGRVPVALHTAPLVGELHAAAARMDDLQRTDPMMNRLMEAMDHARRPATWTAYPNWCGVQAAIFAQSPDRLARHASYLVDAAHHSPLARALATAGQAWTDLVQGRFDEERIDQAVVGLSETGLHWDASRLAGFAATRAPDRDAASVMLQRARAAESGAVASDRSPSELTAREVSVANLVVRGFGYREVGERLFISPRTVEHHVARMKRRLGVSSRRELLDRLRDLLD